METVLRGASVYVILLVIFRLSGRRTMSQATPFDLVLLLVVAETTQQALLADDKSVTNALVLVTVLFSFDVLLSYAKRASPFVDRLLDGVPTVLVTDGRPDAVAMRRSRVTLSDVLAAARSSQGLERLDQYPFCHPRSRRQAVDHPPQLGGAGGVRSPGASPGAFAPLPGSGAHARGKGQRPGDGRRPRGRSEHRKGGRIFLRRRRPQPIRSRGAARGLPRASRSAITMARARLTRLFTVPMAQPQIRALVS